MLRSLEVYSTQINKLMGSDLHLFELSVWIQTFAQSMISVFVPVILYKLGFPIREVFLFYVVFHAIDVPLNIWAKRLIQKYGARKVVMFSIVAQLLYLILLYNLHQSWIQLVFLALFLAIFDAFYWVAHLYIFVKAAHGKNKRLRSDVGALNVIRLIGGFFAPAIGAFILIETNSHTLIFLSTLLMFSSLIPLARMRHLKFFPEEGSTGMREFFKPRAQKILYFFDGLSVIRFEMEGIIWPFYIYLVYENLKTVAFVPILVSVGTLAVTFIAAKMSVRENIYKMIAWGGFGTGIIWALRLMFLGNEFILIGSVLIISLLAILIDVPLEVAVFDRGKHSDILNSVTYLNLIRMFFGGLFFAMLIFFADEFHSSFIIMTVLLFVFGLMSIAAAIWQRNSYRVASPDPVDIEKEGAT